VKQSSGAWCDVSDRLNFESLEEFIVHAVRERVADDNRQETEKQTK
jgi:hypothetical protein